MTVWSVTLSTAAFSVVTAGCTLKYSIYKSDSIDCVSEQSDVEVASPKMSTKGSLGRCGLLEIETTQ